MNVGEEFRVAVSVRAVSPSCVAVYVHHDGAGVLAGNRVMFSAEVHPDDFATLNAALLAAVGRCLIDLQEQVRP